MNNRTKRILSYRDKLKVAMEILIDSVFVEVDDGVCMSDVEFYLDEFKSVLWDFENALLERDTGD